MRLISSEWLILLRLVSSHTANCLFVLVSCTKNHFSNIYFPKNSEKDAVSVDVDALYTMKETNGEDNYGLYTTPFLASCCIFNLQSEI